jgi:hypothetical protein
MGTGICRVWRNCHLVPASSDFSSVPDKVKGRKTKREKGEMILLMVKTRKLKGVVVQQSSDFLTLTGPQ